MKFKGYEEINRTYSHSSSLSGVKADIVTFFKKSASIATKAKLIVVRRPDDNFSVIYYDRT